MGMFKNYLFVYAAAKKQLLYTQRRNKANKITFSNKKTRKWQEINLQYKKIYWYEGQRMVNLCIPVKTIKTIDKKSLFILAKKNGIDCGRYRLKIFEINV